MPHLDAAHTAIEVPKGHVLYKRGEECNSMYLLRSGKIGLYLNFGTAEQFALVVLSKRGSSLGEMGLLEGENRNSTAVALEDSVVVELTKENFPSFIAEHPEDGVQIIKDLANRFTNVIAELKSTQRLVSEVLKEVEEGKLNAKPTLREKLKRVADLFLDVPKDVPPDLYMSFYTRTHSNLL